MRAHISWCCTFLKLEKGTSYREEIEYYHYNCPCSQKGVCVAFPLVWLLMLIVCHLESFKNQVTFTCMLQDTSFFPLFSNLKTLVSIVQHWNFNYLHDIMYDDCNVLVFTEHSRMQNGLSCTQGAP